MKKTRVWRYNCDFCGKRGYSAGHMKNHEDHCTMNPDRKCGMCWHSEEYHQQPIDVLIKVLDLFNPPKESNFDSYCPYGSRNTDYLFELFDGTTDCPACILSAIRQSKREYSDVDEDGYHSFSFEFDFEAAKKIFWEKYPRKTWESY